MSYDQYMMIGREAVWRLFVVTSPVLLGALAVGLVIGIIQAATSINEMTLSFVPKLFAVLVLLALLGPFMLTNLGGLFEAVFVEISRVGQ